MLELQDVSVYYGNIRALNGVSFSVNEGELVALIGSNGAGKSTTLKIISGLLRPREGVILYRGQNITRAATDRIVALGISQCPEGRRIFGGLTVRENLILGAVQRKNGQSLQADLAWIFQLFPRLKERLNQAGGTLSGGEQQMLAIGRALMTNPRLLLMDEPSEGLAPLLVREIGRIIAQLKAHGQSMLLVEQNLLLALSVADRIYVMSKGRLVWEGTPQALWENKELQHKYLGV